MLKINALNTITFGRRLRPDEVEDYNATIDAALDKLGKKTEVILHHASCPAQPDNDTGIGSLYSEASRNLVVPFVAKHGFTSIQVEPEGQRKFGDSSPYTTNCCIKNFLMQDLEKLTTPEYGEILKRDGDYPITYEKIVRHNPTKNENRVTYDYVNTKYDSALKEAWKNFKIKLSENPTPELEKLAHDFEAYKRENADELEPSAIYEILGMEHGNDYWKNWNNDIDKKLYLQSEEVKEHRIAELKEKYADEYEFFCFKQMLISKTRQEGIEELAKNGIKVIGDVPVAYSDVEVWQNPKIFLEGYSMGCPPDSSAPMGQAWGFPVLNPDYLFDEKGNLREGGEFLFKKYQKLFEENRGGVRIDHILGLIDPFVYKTSPTGQDAGRLYSTKHNPDLARFFKTKGYGDVIEKIIIPAAQSVGLDKENIICEDLGYAPEHAKKAFRDLGLRGITITQYTRNSEVPKDNIIMIGSHDSPTLIEYTDNLFNSGDPYNHAAWPLTEDVLPSNASHDEKQDYFDKMRFDYHNSNEAERAKAKSKFMTAKFAQLFTSPSRTIQIFWTDLLGIKERYNTPGTSKGNWGLRMNADFERQYHKNLEEGIGINIPETLEIALSQKGVNKNDELMKSLNHYKNVLKERE